MSMFCYQCQEAAKGTGCTVKGVCGKPEDVANMQDLLMFVLKGISIYTKAARENNVAYDEKINKFVFDGLFATITNANFNKNVFIERVREGLQIRNELRLKLKNTGVVPDESKLHDSATWQAFTPDEFERKAKNIGVLATENEDVRSLRELITYGLKGLAAYTEHAYNLGHESKDLYKFMQDALAATTDDSLTADQLVALTMETGKYGVEAMALLDKANTS
ncbi:MAG TPA: hydroxylamine reductase, partial [Bacteroidales bacterium]|nr:hydroxylamine reductase [Bacteroidales bacterium]